MTEEDVEMQEARALNKCLKLRKVLTVAQNRANDLASEMEVVAKHLRHSPYQIPDDSYWWLVPNCLVEIKRDIANAEAELAVANDEAAVLGVTLPPLK